jgi:L-alanine-DL-glutamate epimerase-like enolase superfamily enzyme
MISTKVEFTSSFDGREHAVLVDYAQAEAVANSLREHGYQGVRIRSGSDVDTQALTFDYDGQTYAARPEPDDVESRIRAISAEAGTDGIDPNQRLTPEQSVKVGRALGIITDGKGKHRRDDAK